MPRKKQGSLKHQLTATLIEGLAKIACTKGEAADAFGVSHEHFSRILTARSELKEAWARGAANGKVSLRRLQWKHARMRNAAGVNMTIHMSKHLLGQHDRALLEGKFTSQVDVIHQLLREIDGQSKGLPTFAKENEPPKMLDLLPDPSKVPERTE